MYQPSGKYQPPLPSSSRQIPPPTKGKGISTQALVAGIKEINKSHPTASPVFREEILLNLLLGYINNPDLTKLIWDEGFGSAFSNVTRQSIGEKPIIHKYV